MKRTKKQAAADLQNTEVAATPAKPRASRSKLAIAQRAVAKATESNDWSAVTDSQVKVVEAAQTRDAARAVINEPAVVAHAAGELAKAVTSPDDIGKALLDDWGVIDADPLTETDIAIKALKDTNEPSPEVVRSLADVSLDDPWIEEPPEEAAVRRLPRGHGVDFAAPTITGIVREMVDILIAYGAWAPPAGDEKEIGKYWADIRQCMIHALSGEEAAKIRLLAAQARKLELDNEQRVPPEGSAGNPGEVTTIVLDTYDLAVEQYDRVLELEAETKTLKTALKEAIKRAKTAEEDAEQKRGIIHRQDERVGDLERLLANRNTEIERLHRAEFAANSR